MRKGRTGKPHDEQARAKMRQARRSRVRADDWTAEEDESVRTMTPAEAVKQTGRTLVAVWSRRCVLELPDGRSARPVRGAPLSEEVILGWARAYRRAKGRWPSAYSPPEHLPEGESWKRLDVSLRRGQRGLPGRPVLDGPGVARRGRHLGPRQPSYTPGRVLVSDQANGSTGRRRVFIDAQRDHRCSGFPPIADSGLEYSLVHILPTGVGLQNRNDVHHAGWVADDTGSADSRVVL